MTYTLAVALGVVVAATLDLVVIRTKLLLRKVFWVAYAIVGFFQLIVNGLLTGLGIVRYDPDRIVGLRIVFAPFEDLLFGFAMVLVTLTGWVWAQRRGVRRPPPAGR
ncbi:MAG: lycopene cyclase domain-containing protein [Jatrophihabitans sp.]